MTTMLSITETQHITRLQFKDEGENHEGLPTGKLTDQNGAPVYPDGRWVTKREAFQIAADLGVELFEY